MILWRSLHTIYQWRALERISRGCGGTSDKKVDVPLFLQRLKSNRSYVSICHQITDENEDNQLNHIIEMNEDYSKGFVRNNSGREGMGQETFIHSDWDHTVIKADKYSVGDIQNRKLWTWL